MSTPVPEKILKIIEDIEREGHVPLTRLTVLKKWFERPERLTAFGLWIARKAAGRKGKTSGPAGELLDEARARLGKSDSYESLIQPIDREAGLALYHRAREFQTTTKKLRWGTARVIQSHPLYLVEAGLAVHLGLHDSPKEGYRLAAEWAENYDSKFGNDLNGPSVGKLNELVRFMFAIEGPEG